MDLQLLVLRKLLEKLWMELSEHEYLVLMKNLLQKHKIDLRFGSSIKEDYKHLRIEKLMKWILWSDYLWSGHHFQKIWMDEVIMRETVWIKLLFLLSKFCIKFKKSDNNKTSQFGSFYYIFLKYSISKLSHTKENTSLGGVFSSKGYLQRTFTISLSI